MRMKILLLLLLSLAAFGEEWITFTEEDGLASNICRCVAVDHDGVVWVGHGDAMSGMGGVSSWDGEEWTTYYSWTTGFGLRSNFINDIAVDQYNNKWFATGTILFDGGLTKFDGDTWTGWVFDTASITFDGYFWLNDIEVFQDKILFTTHIGFGLLEAGIWSYHYIDTTLVVGGALKSLYNSSGLFWTLGASFLMLSVDFDASLVDSIRGVNYTDLLIHDDIICYSSYGKGIFIRTDTSFYHMSGSEYFPNDTIESIEIIDDRFLWIAYNGGIVIRDSLGYAESDWVIDPPHSYTLDIEEDKNNNIYLCSMSGLVVYNRDDIRWGLDESNFAPNETNIKLQAYPTPFNSALQIDGGLNVEKRVFDVRGNLVAVIPGNRWEPEEVVSSGIYFVSISGRERDMVKVVYLK